MPLSNRTILLVEDDEISRLVTSSLLKSLGATVSIADAGDMALKLAETGIYDTILLDLDLPDISGYEVARLLRRHECQTGHKPATILALSANAGVREQELTQAAGIDGLMLKPLDAAMLVSKPPIENLNRNTTDSDSEDEFAWLETNLGDARFFRETLMDAAMVFPQYFNELHSLVTFNRLEEAGCVAHRLGGAAASIGAKKLSKIASEVRTRLSSGESVCLTILETELQQFLQAVKTIVGSMQDSG